MQEYNSEDISEIVKALINVQRQLQPATKDANTPFTKSKYATLNSVMDLCRDALLSNGIWLCQYPVPAEPGYLGLVTKLTHAESGQWQSSLAVVPLPKADPGLGISMTYMPGMRFPPCLASLRRKIRTRSLTQTSSTALRDRKTP
ncbi:MAG: ERF family protein [Bilophila wadsworthia]